MRRGSNGTFDANFSNVITYKTTGEFVLSHHISPEGFYKGRKVIEVKKKKTVQE